MYECLNVLNNFCFHVYAQNLLSHFLTLTLSHSHSFSLSHSFNLSFNHSRHAEQVLFSSVCSKVAVNGRKLQWFFLDIIFLDIIFLDITLPCQWTNHRAGSQLKRRKQKQNLRGIRTNCSIVIYIEVVNQVVNEFMLLALTSQHLKRIQHCFYEWRYQNYEFHLVKQLTP